MHINQTLESRNKKEAIVPQQKDRIRIFPFSYSPQCKLTVSAGSIEYILDPASTVPYKETIRDFCGFLMLSINHTNLLNKSLLSKADISKLKIIWSFLFCQITFPMHPHKEVSKKTETKFVLHFVFEVDECVDKFLHIPKI